MSYTASQTCKIVGGAKGPRRTHELDPVTGKARCAARNKAASRNTYAAGGRGTVNCLRCARP